MWSITIAIIAMVFRLAELSPDPALPGLILDLRLAASEFFTLILHL
jgi:hypothetical protein